MYVQGVGLSGTTLMQPVNTESCFVPVDQHNKGLDAQFIARAPVQLLADGWHSLLCVNPPRKSSVQCCANTETLQKLTYNVFMPFMM
jgi:hypothetical protein